MFVSGALSLSAALAAALAASRTQGQRYRAKIKHVLAPELVAVMVCPKSKQAVVTISRAARPTATRRDAFLLYPASRLRYRIDDGVRVFLIEEATELPAPGSRPPRPARA